MRLLFFFARRYILGGSRLGAVGWITLISAVAIGIVAMAMVLVLSVYNGYVSMIEEATDISSPELIITPREGTTIDLEADEQLRQTLADGSVAHYALVLEGLGMLRSSTGEEVVQVTGIDEAYWQIVPRDSLLLDGQPPQIAEDTVEAEQILLGLGILSTLEQGGQGSEIYTLFFPRRQGMINPLLPSTAFRSRELRSSGILRPVSEELDRKAYIHRQLMQELLGYEGQVASYIALKGRGSAEELRTRLRPLLPKAYELKNRQEQHPELTLLIRVEKIMVYIIMVFILLLATFNLISGLAMLIMEKQSDLKLLSALGMQRSEQSRVFALVGLIISLLGASVGLVVGCALGLVQQTWMPLKAGAGEMAMPFPIVMKPSDFAIILLGILSISLITSCFLSLFMRKQTQ